MDNVDDIDNPLGEIARDDPPDGRDCQGCGATVEPTETEFGWMPPGRLCEQCLEARRGPDTDGILEERWKRAVSSLEHRRLVESTDQPVHPKLAQVFDEQGEFYHGVYVHGDVGVGKTTLGARACRAFLAEKIGKEGDATATAQLVNEAEVFAQIRESYDDDSTATSEVVERYVEADLLVLDDLGTSRGTAWVAEQLFRLLNRRKESLRPTVLMSNLTFSELREHRAYDPRTLRRIYAMCGEMSDDRVLELTRHQRG